MTEKRHPFDFSPNSYDQEGNEYYNPWNAMGVHCGGYGGDVDWDIIRVLRIIGGPRESSRYNLDIAKETGLAPNHVELIQYLLCSADWCDYGTSPRGCFPNYGNDFAALIAAWEGYYVHHWGEPLPA